MTAVWELVIQNAEDAYSDYARQAEDAPHKWGEAQTAELARLAATLKSLYEKHNVGEFDRVAL